jgi:hypothetical protein
MNKLDQAIQSISKSLSLSKSPVVAWSGGKDSMVLLDIIKNKMGVKTPVILFREPWQPRKYQFQDSIIRDWELECYSWHPFHSAFQQTGGEFEVQHYYRFDTTVVTCPSGITEIVEGKPWACAIDMANRPKQHSLVTGWTDVFIGHKACDSDPIYGGDAGTRIDVRIVPGQATMHFPLKNWTHDDIWEYIVQNNLPWDKDRYEVSSDSKFTERKDKTSNADYINACVACVDKRSDAAKFVYCPKYKGYIENCSSSLTWADQTKPSYMND